MNSEMINEILEFSLFNGNQDMFPFALEKIIQH